MHTSKLALALGAALALTASVAVAQDRGGGRRPPPRPEGPVAGSGQSASERTLIQWFGTWDGAKAEARRTGKPILLLAAAPQCRGISGIW